MPDPTTPSPGWSPRRLADTAVVLLAVFPVTVTVLNLVQRQHYDVLRDAVSLLALGTGGAAMNAAFFGLGVGIGLMALVLRRSIGKGIAGPALLNIAALAAFTSGIFHTNANDAPSTTQSDIHMVAGITVFLSMVAAMFVFAWRFRHDPRWRRFAGLTLIWAVAGTVTFLLIPVAGDARFGLAQRLHIAVWLSWLLVTGLRARRLNLGARDAYQQSVQTSSAAGKNSSGLPGR
jgi:hypothetical membrane protein